MKLSVFGIYMRDDAGKSTFLSKSNIGNSVQVIKMTDKIPVNRQIVKLSVLAIYQMTSFFPQRLNNFAHDRFTFEFLTIFYHSSHLNRIHYIRF